MVTSQKGLDLVKKFEGLRLKAYKAIPSEKLYTIGYGHYGVSAGMEITEKEAEDFLKNDLKTAEKAVNGLNRQFNQNEFDALVSFTYNCGAANLKKLCANDRSKNIIACKILLYNKAGGKVLRGLQRRREAERELFLSNVGV